MTERRVHVSIVLPPGTNPKGVEADSFVGNYLTSIQGVMLRKILIDEGAITGSDLLTVHVKIAEEDLKEKPIYLEEGCGLIDRSEPYVVVGDQSYQVKTKNTKLN